MTRIREVLLVGFAALSVTLAGCGGGAGNEPSDAAGTGSSSSAVAGTSGTNITVNLSNWAIEPSTTEIAAGTYTFIATHEEGHGAGHGTGTAGATHQLVVARLPDGASPGESKFGSPLLSLTDIKPGAKKSDVVALEPGRYELSCLIVEKVGGKDVNHYAEGMYTLLTVH